MKAKVPLDSLLDRRVFTLKPKGLLAYVQSRGWKPYPHSDFPLWAHEDFRNDDGDLMPEIVPPRMSDDFYQRAIELLRALSDFENRPALDIMEDMLALQEAPAKNGANGSHQPRRARKSAK